MKCLCWRVERVKAEPAKTKVRIELKRDLDKYSYEWFVADKRTPRLKKREIHELDMRVAKYVASLSQTPPRKPEERTLYTSL